MSPLQFWLPGLVTLVATLIVVVLTAWWNVRSLGDQMRMLESKLDARLDSVRNELWAEIQALRAEMKQSMAELELRISKQIMELSQRVERLEEARGLVRQ